MFSPMMSSSWSDLSTIMVNSTPVFFTSATFMCGFWNKLFYFKSTRETCAHVYFFPSLSSKNLNALAMRIMYHKTDQTSFLYGLTRPSLGRCDSMLRLKLFLKKVGLSQPSFRIFESENNKKKKLLLFDDDGTNSRIKTPDADNRTFGLVNTDDDYPDRRVEYQTRKCRTPTIYNNNNNNNSNHNFEDNDTDSSQVNRTYGLVNNTDDDYLECRVECRTLTIYYNRNYNYNSENNVDNNFKGNHLHLLSQADYNSSSTPTGSKLNFYTATERNAKDDNNKWRLSCSHDIAVNQKNKNSENNADNNSYSNNNNHPCADSEDNNDNNTDGNFISASTPPPSDSNADNAPPGRNNKNNVRPKFISHPNGIVLRVFKWKSNKPRQTQNLLLPPPRKPRELPPPPLRDRNADNGTEQADNGTEQSVKRLPSFISHPNGILLRVFKRQRSMIETSLKKRSGPRFICHPNGIVLKVLNQKPRPRTKSTSSSSMVKIETETKTEAKTDQNGANSCAVAISIRNRRIPTPSSSSLTVKMEKETYQHGNKQRVKQLKRVKQRANHQHYSHAHHWPPQQQYKSKSWTIAIILKLTFVAWDSWTYRIGY